MSEANEGGLGLRTFTSDRIKVGCRVALCCLWLGALVFYLTTLLNHDTSWYLIATGRMFDGARLYRDIIEVNPPLAFFLTVPAVALARVTDLSPEASFVIYFMLLIAGSLFLAERLSVGAALKSNLAKSAMLAATFFALVLMPMPMFGEREHFLLVLAVPYVFLLSNRLGGTPCGAMLATGIGLTAALGFALKLYFLIVPILLEGYYVAKAKTWRVALRPETVSVLFFGILYLAFVAIHYPEYFTVIIPFANLTYSAYTITLSKLLLSPLILFVGLLLLGHIGNRVSKVVSITADPLALFATALLSIYLIQSKGWAYQFMPVLSAIFLLLSYQGIQGIEGGIDLRRLQKALFLAFTVLSLGLISYPTLSHGWYRSEFSRQALPLLRQCSPEGPIHALTSDLWVGFPLVNQSRRIWGSRYPAQWLLPGAVNQLSSPDSRSPEVTTRLPEIEQYVRDTTLDDLRRWPPTVIIVDLNSPFFKGQDFDYVEFFQKDPGFAEIWRQYVKSGTILTFFDGPRKFEVWCRIRT